MFFRSVVTPRQIEDFEETWNVKKKECSLRLSDPNPYFLGYFKEVKASN